MHFTLIQPPLEDFYFTPHRASGLGLQVLSILLSRRGHTSTILNFPASGIQCGSSEPGLPPFLAYLQPYILPNEIGPVSFFHTFRRFGPDAGKCAAAVAASRPDAVFLSIMAFCYSLAAIELAAEIKRRCGSVPLIAGGAGASVYPDYFLRSGAVDAVVPGEAEARLAPLLKELENGGMTTACSGTAGPEMGGANPQEGFGPGASPGEPPPAEMLEFPFTVTGRTKKRLFIATTATRGCNKACAFAR